MNEETKTYFSTGDFAKLCGVKKDTLYHYEQIGIMKPEIIKENRYRYYSMNQLFTFDIISVLKECGTPLKEIKNYIEHQDTDYFLTILKSKRDQLAKEKKKIQRMEILLENTIDLTNRALLTECGIPWCEECIEEYLIAVPLNHTTNHLDSERMNKLRLLLDYLADHNLGDEYPLSSIILKDHLKENLFIEDFYCSRLSESIDSEYLFIKPQGRYAIITHKGSYETIKDSYKKLMDYIKENDQQISGNSYEHELLNYLAVGNPDQFIIEIAIQIA
ncbi:MAG: MerR family transcriptional regulator [Acetobacterium sp.]